MYIHQVSSVVIPKTNHGMTYDVNHNWSTGIYFCRYYSGIAA